jgi:phosphate transport system permease protein
MMEFQSSRLATWTTGLALWGILLLLAAVLLLCSVEGAGTLWRWAADGAAAGPVADLPRGGLASLVLGTVRRVFLMTLMVLPLGVATAVYLSEYSRPRSWATRFLRLAITQLAGVPSIVLGLFGLGFLVGTLGQNLDLALGDGPRFGRPGLFWSAAVMALLTLPVVIVSTEEALRSVPSGSREVAMALGATRFQVVCRIAIPHAAPGILTGLLLAVGRAAGEVAPILLTGAAYSTDAADGGLWSRFMDLAYHVFFLATQAPDPERARPILGALSLLLLILTLTMNLLAAVVRNRIRRPGIAFN